MLCYFLHFDVLKIRFSPADHSESFPRLEALRIAHSKIYKAQSAHVAEGWKIAT